MKFVFLKVAIFLYNMPLTLKSCSEYVMIIWDFCVCALLYSVQRTSQEMFAWQQPRSEGVRCTLGCLPKQICRQNFHLKFQLHLSPLPPHPHFFLMGKEESIDINASPDLVVYFGIWLAYTGLPIGGKKSVFPHDYFSICVGVCSLVEFN